MFFILSKVLYFLLVPFWWIVILLVWMYFSKSPLRRKRLRIAAILITVVFTNPFLFYLMVMGWQTPPISLPSGSNYEAGIVLGGIAGYDKNQRGHFGGNADRFIQTANLYHRGIIKKIIITGGTGSLSQDEPAESIFLRSEFMNNGIHDSDIVVESRSRNTYENAVYTKKITDSMRTRPPFVLITSGFHMKRAAAVFNKTGFQFIPYPCDYKVTPTKFSIDALIPNVSLLNDWSYMLKEVVGLYVYKLTGKA